MANIERRVTALETKTGYSNRRVHCIMWNAKTGWPDALNRYGQPIEAHEDVLSIEIVGVLPGIPEETSAVLAGRRQHDEWMQKHKLRML
jgi:hypothetical protein